MKYPHQNDLYYNIFSGEFAVVECMGKSLTFYTAEYGRRCVMDTYLFIIEFNNIQEDL